MSKTKVILRGDGNQRTGLGHIFRLLSLAQMLNGHFECFFAGCVQDSFVLNEIRNTCKEFIEIGPPPVAKLSDEITRGEEIQFDLGDYLNGDEIVILDGYLFGSKYQQEVKEAGSFLISIDDLAMSHFYADAVINHAPGINTAIYKTENYTDLLTGLDYAILRQPFYNDFSRRPASRNAFVSLGGTDYYGYTYKLVELIVAEQFFDTINILISSSFQTGELEKLLKLQHKVAGIQLHCNLSAEALCGLLDSCSHSFVAASTVLVESYSRGLKCFTGYYTNNQKLLYEGFTSNGMAASLGPYSELNAEVFKKAFRTEGQVSVSTQPFTSCNIKNYLLGIETNLREACWYDCVAIFDLANEHTVRQNAINTEPIIWEDHLKWFKEKLASPGSKFFVLEKKGVFAGQIRFDYSEGECAWYIDYSVKLEFRGMGFGTLLIKRSFDYFQKGDKLVALVKQDNQASLSVFKKFGFSEEADVTLSLKGLIKLKYLL